ncbi:MAG: MFS transporter [Streptosporangiales bacterium]|nr:MFS transporter [Streptosporangiales bacterium]
MGIRSTVGAATMLVLVVFTTVITTATETARSFHASIAWQTWALGGMSLGLAGALLTAGALADAFGRRRVFVISSVALAVSTALGAASPSMLVFVAARILQGAAGAGVVASGLGLIGHAFPPGPSRAHATGIWGAMLAGGIAIGPILGAGLAAAFGWRSAYGLEALGAAVLAGAGHKLLPESRGKARPRRIDPPGALTMLIAMACLTAGLTSGRSGWTSPTTVILLAAGLAALAAFAWIEVVRPDPMLDLGLLRRPLFLVSIGGAAVTGLATVALMSYAPTLIEQGLHRSAPAAGGILAVWSVTSMLVAMQAHRLPARVDARGRLIAGLLLSASGSAALTGLAIQSSWWRLVPGLLLAGIGSGPANAALARLAVESVPRASMALGGGANNTARYLGSALGIALLVAVVASGGAGQAGLIHGWNRAALLAALLNVAGAILAAACRER